MRSLLLILGLISFPFGSGLAAEEVVGGLDDELGLLYSSQLLFGVDGTPLVTVGIMDGQARVAVSSPDGLELSFRERVGTELVEKKVNTRKGEVLVFVPTETIAAQVAYWCGVESIPFGNKEILDQTLAVWRERGESVQVFEVGSVFGIQGHVIDNRTYILGIRSLGSEAAANDLVQEIYQRYGTRTFVHPHLTRRSAGLIKIQRSTGSAVGLAVDLVRLRSVGKQPVTVFRVEFGQGYAWHGFENREFAGTILLTLDRKAALAVVNLLPVDRLLDGLVPAEIFPSAPMEALKAQAVVARGEVLAKIGSRHFLDPYRLCASTHCQVFSGVRIENPRTSQAVSATRGEFLFRGPVLVDSVYSASCGGHTEDNESVWSYQPPNPALRGRPDMAPEQAHLWPSPSERLSEWLVASPPAYCRVSSFNRKDIFRWRRTISSANMDRLVSLVKPIGHVVSIQVLSRGISGRVKVVRVVGTEGELVVQGEWPVRQLFGTLKSGMFEVSVETDENQMPIAYRFVGGGWGHGVGMCQIGATGMAEHGFDYRQILAHFYGGARVFRLFGDAAMEARPEPGAEQRQLQSEEERGTPIIPSEP